MGLISKMRDLKGKASALKEGTVAIVKVIDPGDPAFCSACGALVTFDALDVRGAATCPNCGKGVRAVVSENSPYRRYGPEVFRFSRGSYFGGMREYSIRCLGESCRVSVHGANGDFVDESNTVTKRVVRDKVIKPVRGLDWEEDYEPACFITDGYTWAIDVDFDGSRFHSGGYVVTPRDYEAVTDALEDMLCWLIAYGDDYEGKSQIDKLRIWPEKAIERVFAQHGLSLYD